MPTLCKVLVILSVPLWISGCLNYAAPAGPEAALTAPERNFEALWRASYDVLRRYRFELDHRDRRTGTLVSAWMTGAYFGEFWRDDAATQQDLAESTIQTIYRQATVRVHPSSYVSESFDVTVEVKAYRSNQQEPQVSSTSDAHQLFDVLGTERQKTALLDFGKDQEAETAVPLGRDENLEQELAAEIRAAAQEILASL